MMRGLVAAALALFAFAEPAWALSDLVITELSVTPNYGRAGATVEVRFAVFNVGDRPARSSVNLVLVPATSVPQHEGVVVGEWEGSADALPGIPAGHTLRFTVPASGPTSTGYLCAQADLVNLVRESNENNNRRCVTFDATAPKPNLVIRSITQGGLTGTARSMRIVIQNIGRAPAGEFYVEAFDAPAHRYTLHLAPGPATTRAVYVPSLAAGESRTLDAWFVLPGAPASGSRHSIDIVVDGCNPALSPTLPRYCHVDETVEADNTRRIVVVAP